MSFSTELLLSTILLSFSLAIGCDRGSTGSLIRPTEEHIEILTIGPYTKSCQGLIEQQCFLEFNEERQRWELFYEGIQGFDFKPGYIYTLKVRLEERDPDIQDVGRYAYYLVELLNKEVASVDEGLHENCNCRC